MANKLSLFRYVWVESNNMLSSCREIYGELFNIVVIVMTWVGAFLAAPSTECSFLFECYVYE